MVILVLCNMTLVVVTTFYDWKRLSIEQRKITDRQRLEKIRKILNKENRDRPSRILFKALINKPKLLVFGRMLLRAKRL